MDVIHCGSAPVSSFSTSRYQHCRADQDYDVEPVQIHRTAERFSTRLLKILASSSAGFPGLKMDWLQDLCIPQ
jgi:hypothetical protein